MSMAVRDGEEKAMRQECFVVADFGAGLCHLCHWIWAFCSQCVWPFHSHADSLPSLRINALTKCIKRLLYLQATVPFWCELSWYKSSATKKWKEKKNIHSTVPVTSSMGVIYTFSSQGYLSASTPRCVCVWYSSPLINMLPLKKKERPSKCTLPYNSGQATTRFLPTDNLHCRPINKRIGEALMQL